MEKIFKILIVFITIVAVNSCTERVFLVEEIPTNTTNNIIYFGNIDDINYSEKLDKSENENCKTLVNLIKNLKSYMGNNLERLNIRDWHQFDDIEPIIPLDSIPLENNLFSYDGENRRQIGSSNGYDYFWKTDNLWLLVWGISDKVVQKSDYSEGNHIYFPSSVDNSKDSIYWSKTQDSLIITVDRTGGYGRDDVSFWLNTKTNSGKLEYNCGECINSYLKDIYFWNANGSGTYYQYDLITKIQTQIDSWE